MDEAERIDLALNSDFDSDLLNCWEESNDKLNVDGEFDAVNRNENSEDSVNTERQGAWSTTSSQENLITFPRFLIGDDQEQPDQLDSNDVDQQPIEQLASKRGAMDSVEGGRFHSIEAISNNSVSMESSIATSKRQPASLPSNDSNDNESSSLHASSTLHFVSGPPSSASTTTHLHPQAIQSSASCPPYDSSSRSYPSLNSVTAGNQSLVPIAFAQLAAVGINVNSDVPLSAASTQPQVPPDSAGSQMAFQDHIPSEFEFPRGNTGRTTHSQFNGATKSQQPSLPPFYLFSAPAELRHNFIQCQRSLGIPVHEDANSMHYELAAQTLHSSNNSSSDSNVRLIDGRHADEGMKRIKNAKEQKRAQRITELIDELRAKMESGGWKVGVKSKFQTLSSCADYVRHLVKANHEKEEAVGKARDDLEAKRRKIEFDKVQQQEPSDPESTTSSLTVSTGSAGASDNKQEENLLDESPKKRHAEDIECSDKKKKARFSSHESSVSSSSTSSGIGKLPGKSVSMGQTASVSDITDSMEGSASSNDRRNVGGSCCGSLGNNTGSVSSDAAVASGHDSGKEKRGEGHYTDFVYERRKRKGKQPSNLTSIDPNFQLDYEEIFLKSNIPQLLSTTSGRIVAWNDFFLKMSGLKDSDVERLTIFSFVQASRLSNLFELVAAALRTGTEKIPIEKEGFDCKQSETTHAQKDFSVITLPCIEMLGKRKGKTCNIKQLYLTVTLMADDDPRKRCFHCVFTDCPGTNGALGSVTPELLTMMFTTAPGHRDISSTIRRKGAVAKHSK